MLWLIATIFYLISATNPEFASIGVIAPLLFCSLSIIIFRSLPYENFRILIAYLLFFSTSILSFNYFLTPLTGVVTQSSNALLFGFSFYTASLAYLAMNSGTPNLLSAFKIANPFLLATGPIALFIS